MVNTFMSSWVKKTLFFTGEKHRTPNIFERTSFLATLRVACFPVYYLNTKCFVLVSWFNFEFCWNISPSMFKWRIPNKRCSSLRTPSPTFVAGRGSEVYFFMLPSWDYNVSTQVMWHIFTLGLRLGARVNVEWPWLFTLYVIEILVPAKQSLCPFQWTQ